MTACTALGTKHVLFDIRKLDLRGSAMWMGCAQSYSFALFEIELTTAKRRVIMPSLTGKQASEPS
jgi:hypothetical protein